MKAKLHSVAQISTYQYSKTSSSYSTQQNSAKNVLILVRSNPWQHRTSHLTPTLFSLKNRNILEVTMVKIRDLKIAVYGKLLILNTLFAIKTKSLTVKCFTYKNYSKYRKRRTETLCLATETWRLIFDDFSAHIA